MRLHRHLIARRGGARHLSAVAALVALALPLSGCGTRMSEEAVRAADGTAISSQAGSLADGAFGSDAAAVAPATGDSGGVRTVVPGAVDAGAGPVSAGGATGARVLTAKGGKAGDRAPGASADVPAAGAAVGAPACERPLAPIVVGHTSPTSGIIGQSTFNMRAGVVLWSRAVNAAGGVQCHPVQVVAMDDGADPARVSSNLNEMKKRGAVAILGAGIETTFSAARQFAEREKIPFIGGGLTDALWYSSPLFFPQGGSPLAQYAGATKAAAAAAKTKKVGLLYCVEASICGAVNQNFEAMAKEAGLEVVIRKVSSITSPDYTAECQALKAAGAEAAFFAFDGSAVVRAARSCVAVGYTPPVAVSAVALNAEAARDPNVRKMGLYLGTANTPFTTSDTPGIRAFRAAYDRHSPGALIDQNLAMTWAAGKLFEKAMEHVADRARSSNVTSEMVFAGLYQVKNETLDRLAPPITFNKDARPTLNNCYGVIHLTDAGFSTPYGSKLSCLPGLPGGF